MLALEYIVSKYTRFDKLYWAFNFPTKILPPRILSDGIPENSNELSAVRIPPILGLYVSGISFP